VIDAFAFGMDGRAPISKAFAIYFWVSWKAESHARKRRRFLMDEIGFVEAGRIIGEIGRAAFPSSDCREDGAADQGNGKAGKKSPLNQDPIDSTAFGLAGAGLKKLSGVL